LLVAQLEWLLGVAVIVAVLAMNLRGLPGSMLGDDFSHFNVIAQTDRQGQLAEWLLGNFVRPLGNGNFAYRPILFLSYALDWRLWGANPVWSHLTNLALHVVNSLLVGYLAHRWASRRPTTAGIVAGAVFAAYPFAGEVTFWIAGRADLLAALFGVLFLLTLRGPPGRRLAVAQTLRIVLLFLALLSKESAIPLPLIGTVLLVTQRWAEDEPGRWNSGVARSMVAVREALPIWVAFAAYLAWRFWLFGTLSSVYTESRTPSGLGEYLDRLALLRTLGERQSDLPWPTLWPIVFVLLLSALALIWARAQPGRKSASVMAAFVIAGAIYVLSPALSFPAAGATGEGARNYYVAWSFVSTAIGLFAEQSRLTRAVSILFAGWMLLGQDGSMRQWQEAARLMRAVTNAVPALAREIGPDRYAALLLPDHIGVALFARNAQDGIVIRPTQRFDYLDRMAGMTEPDIDHWRALLANGGLDALHGRHLAIEAFAGVFCFNEGMRFVKIDQGGAIPGPDWPETLLRKAATAGCVLGDRT